MNLYLEKACSATKLMKLIMEAEIIYFDGKTIKDKNNLPEINEFYLVQVYNDLKEVVFIKSKKILILRTFEVPKDATVLFFVNVKDRFLTEEEGYYKEVVVSRSENKYL